MTCFEEEIRAQPDILERLLHDPALTEVAAGLRTQDIRLVVSLARGSSDNAVAFFSYLAGWRLGLPVASLPPSLLTVYEAKLKLEHTLAVAVSQSGESSDVVEGLKALRAAGALTLSVTNQPDSSLARAADFSLAQRAGDERAVAASKTFSSQMMVLAALLAHWAEDRALLAGLEAVPEGMRALLADQRPLERAASRLDAESCYVLGRGLSYGPALELALKLKETSYMHAQAYSSAEFQHGPIAAVDADEPIILLGLDDGTLKSNLEVAERLKVIGADLTVISGVESLLALADTAVPLPANPHPAGAAFLQVLAGQLLALHLALGRNLDPDAPRHLSKVTKTL